MILPSLLALLVGVLLVTTPPYVTPGSGILHNADSIPGSALWLWIADLCVVGSVVLCRRAPRLAIGLGMFAFLVALTLGVIPLGWWVALVVVAAVLGLESWQRAMLPMVASLAVVTTFALTNIPFLTPIGPVYAAPPMWEIQTPPSGLRAGITEIPLEFGEVTTHYSDLPSEEWVEVVPQDASVSVQGGGVSAVVVPDEAVIVGSFSTTTAFGYRWETRIATLSAYLALTTVVVGGSATIAAARRARDARRSARATYEAAIEESLAAEAATQHANVVETVVTERTRVARDLHDVVAHHISLVAVRAESARFTIKGLPDEGRTAFADIADEARGALGELRQILTVLQRSDGEGVPEDGSAPRMPQPGSTDIPDLVQAATQAGQRVELVGAVPELPPSEGLALYRMVQESLTNARRHAPGAPVTIEIGEEGDGYRVRISNPTTTRDPADDAAAPRPGRGLLGMRERIELLEGALTVTGSGAPNPRFTVEALLPAPATNGTLGS